MLPLKPLPTPDLAHERSNASIRFVARNQIATNDTLHRIVFPEVSTATAQKLISKMIKRGLLKRCFFYGSKSYLRLGPAAIARWRYPQALARRPGPQVFPYLWGALSLCSKSKPPLVRLFPHEVEAIFPGFPSTRDLQQWALYGDEASETPRLGMIRVEFRCSGRTVVEKLAEQLHRYRQHTVVDSMLNRQQLFVHVVTATAEQEASIWEAAEAVGLAIELRTCHDPSLTLFL